MSRYNDVEQNALVIRAREDDNAFSELVSRYTPMINKVVNGFLGSNLQYNEAFAEACVALHRALLSYDVARSSDVTFGLYARICVQRRLCDFAEKRARDAALSSLDVDSVSQENNIEQSLLERESFDEYLRRARNIMSEYEYGVFILYVEGYSSREIADRFGKSVKSVENAKARSFKRLRGLQDALTDV